MREKSVMRKIIFLNSLPPQETQFPSLSTLPKMIFERESECSVSALLVLKYFISFFVSRLRCYNYIFAKLFPCGSIPLKSSENNSTFHLYFFKYETHGFICSSAIYIFFVDRFIHNCQKLCLS